VVTSFAYHGITRRRPVSPPKGGHQVSRPSRAPGATTGPRRHREPVDSTESGSQSSTEVDEAVGELMSSGNRRRRSLPRSRFTSDGIVGRRGGGSSRPQRAIRAGGGLFIADEVQAGYGRTGEGLWSITSSGVEPDVMTLGKPDGQRVPGGRRPHTLRHRR